MVDGAFDPLHRGHIEYFSAAAEQLDVPLLCNVASDRYVRTKHRAAAARRRSARRSSTPSASSATRTSTSSTPRPILRELQPKYYVKGRDWEGRGCRRSRCRSAREHGIEIVYLDTVLDSSSRFSRATSSGAAQARAHEHHRVRAARPRPEAGGVAATTIRVLHGRLARRGQQLQAGDAPADRGEEPVADQGRLPAEESARPRLRPRRADASAVGARRRRRGHRLRREQQAAGHAARSATALPSATSATRRSSRRRVRSRHLPRGARAPHRAAGEADGRQHGADDVEVHLRDDAVPSQSVDACSTSRRSSTSIRRTSRCSTRTCCA